MHALLFKGPFFLLIFGSKVGFGLQSFRVTRLHFVDLHLTNCYSEMNSTVATQRFLAITRHVQNKSIGLPSSVDQSQFISL